MIFKQKITSEVKNRAKIPTKTIYLPFLFFDKP